MTTQALPRVRDTRWTALAVLAMVQFMLVLDVTVVNVALTSIQHDLSFSRAGLTWVVDGYVLTAGGLLLLGGRLADLLGRKRMFMIGVSLFTVASLASGAAQSAGMLVASRFVQGAGEALAAPAAFGLIALLFTEPADRAKAVGIFGGVAGLGGTFGPIISGLLIQISWRWIFFVNLPVALISMYMVNKLVDESRADARAAGTRPDLGGAVLITGGLSGVVYGLIQAGTHPWGSGRVLVPLLVGIVVIAAFVLLESRLADPLVPLRFFTNRTRVTANVVTLFFSSIFFTMFFLLTLYLENVQGYSALKTGLAYLPFGIAIGAGIGISTALLPKIGVKPLLGAGFVLFAVGIALLSTISVGGSYVTEVLPGLLLMALGSGLGFVGFGNASVHEVSREDASLASGVQNAGQQIGGAVGLAVLATIALRHAAGAAAGGLDLAHASTSGYVLAFRIGAIVMVLGAVAVFLLLGRVSTADPADLLPESVTAPQDAVPASA